jgi:hypothetical protein
MSGRSTTLLVMSDFSLQVPLPLDNDGFLRRACDACRREFKWRPSDDSEPMPADGYACPYCAERSGADSWFTDAQAEFVTRTAGAEVLGPMLDKYETQGFKVTKADPPTPLFEPNDMRRVVFECHPKEPIKVLDEWNEPVHCLICGEVSTSP